MITAQDDDSPQPPKYSYEILPRPVELGGGWRLRLLEEGEEVGGDVFPAADDPEESMRWWNASSEEERAHWLTQAASARPADAYHAYLLVDTYADAEATAFDWFDSRRSV